LQPFPAIISVAEHAAVLEKVAPVLPKKTPAPKRLYLLSGILHCYSCGRPMRVGGNRENLNYRCGARSEGQLCNSGVAASTRRIEKAITDLFLSRYGAERMYRERTVVEGVDDLAEINEEIKDVMRELSSAVSPEAVERLQGLQEKRSEAEARPPVKRTFREPTGESVALWWESAHLDDRRDALRNAYGRITLHPGRPGAHGFDVRRLTFERSTEEE
jgi:hypothetical protein